MSRITKLKKNSAIRRVEKVLKKLRHVTKHLRNPAPVKKVWQ